VFTAQTLSLSAMRRRSEKKKGQLYEEVSSRFAQEKEYFPKS
jgi:hypothetical protein